MPQGAKIKLHSPFYIKKNVNSRWIIAYDILRKDVCFLSEQRLEFAHIISELVQVQSSKIFMFKFIILLAKGPGVSRRILKKFQKSIFGKKTNFRLCLAYVTPRIPMGSLKKFQTIRYSRLAGYTKHIYEVLFYYID